MKKFTAKKRHIAKAVMRNRRGSEMIEAAAVLPLLILLILSLILLIVYYYTCISCQVNLHQSLLEEAAGSARGRLKTVERRQQYHHGKRNFRQDLRDASCANHQTRGGGGH